MTGSIANWWNWSYPSIRLLQLIGIQMEWEISSPLIQMWFIGGPCTVWDVFRVVKHGCKFVIYGQTCKFQNFYNIIRSCFLQTHEIVHEKFQNIWSLFDWEKLQPSFSRLEFICPIAANMQQKGSTSYISCSNSKISSPMSH